ncbi:Gfo/Idh/MocA family protein [Fructilactobacillus fructivorans]|uniref:Oxidoreductase, Gfo/Idh/MocA family n=1 Tax=Fructilactobacillus fructivorans TaxID=1614 RepID=A0A0C1Q0C5_9LACO|nr:Gfo/Idh/MocA family oxidoreductase [Fructilactobacillus fructivorans]KID41348.1 oxidoreductase, Gfo/Idh/MocA family [Fructilactobacillus fructivorans]MCT0151766.1 gfo/Idh/MocA family oxidoreductase [Fructilactobacillus fructivorans]MCT2867106.1 gfo/Idh/MocA family oxidoreductase [Fructilactobacillus fructivorans]MCT2868334.1 gfo/Idh/MocA family oxidoreductase [Fructilactobacillus fructivorans]MCT2873042.1 gfo/Idh/MocA family oxidoreductase [Fructilactobacillus fructivorans]
MINLGVIGTNWITQKFIDAAASTGKYKLNAVYSRKLDTARQFAQPNDCDNLFDDLQVFFESNKFDTVYIASPNAIHYQQVIAALKHDKNVIVEKPAFIGPYQFQSAMDTLKKHPKARLMEAARNVHMPAFKAVQDQIDDIEIDGAEFTYSKYSSRYDKVLNGEIPNVFNLKFGGGALEDLGVYPVYDTVALFGLPRTQMYYPKFISTGADGGGVAVLNYGTFNVTLNFSKVTTSYQQSEIYCGRQTILIDSAGDFTEAKLMNEGRESQIAPAYTDNPMIPEANDFAEIINHPGNPVYEDQYVDGLNVMQKVNALMGRLADSAGIEYLK